MENNIRQVVENMDSAKAQRLNGNPVYNTEEVLGSLTRVKGFAAFYETHKKDIEIVKLHLLLQYCEGLSFTPEQYSAYRLGLDGFVKFFESAASDVEIYTHDAQEKNRKKSVG